MSRSISLGRGHFTQALANHLAPVSYQPHPSSLLAADLSAHAKTLSDAFLAAERLLEPIGAIPSDLLSEYERDYGLPLLCGAPVYTTDAERIAEIERVQDEGHAQLDEAGIRDLFARYNQTVGEIRVTQPTEIDACRCIDPVRSASLRFKAFVELVRPITVDLACLQRNYLPASLKLVITEID